MRGLTTAADLEDADSPFADYRHDLKRKSQYARASDPDFLSDPRPYKKVWLHLCAASAVAQTDEIHSASSTPATADMFCSAIRRASTLTATLSSRQTNTKTRTTWSRLKRIRMQTYAWNVRALCHSRAA